MAYLPAAVSGWKPVAQQASKVDKLRLAIDRFQTVLFSPPELTPVAAAREVPACIDR